MTNPYLQLFAQHRTAGIPRLWDWQSEILESFPESGDAAIELPTGTGKTLVGLLVGEHHRLMGGRVAFLTGTKQLAQQVERQGTDISIPLVRFQGSKEGWRPKDVRTYNFGEAVAVMNYWAYFNASPGVEPADLLILDDVHLLESRLRDMFTLTVPSASELYDQILRIVYDRCPYYTIAGDLLHGVQSPLPPEMLAFPDSLDMAGEARDLIDGSLAEGSPAWWSWQQLRARVGVCCWLVSRRAITITPFVPPAQTLEHFRAPARRLYMSATIGDEGDLRRRLGAPEFQRLTAQVQPQQGQRFVVLGDSLVPSDAQELMEFLAPVLDPARKALWLCARGTTASELVESLQSERPTEPVLLLEGDNGADETFAALETGHLVTAGRYDGMDFPGQTCRLEILPEVPVATSEIEEWASAYLRDAAFADGRFAQRVVQALGRCNRTEGDRAVYLLADPEFAARFSRRSVIDQLTANVYSDVREALDRSDEGFWPAAETSLRFLTGEDVGGAVRDYRPQSLPILGDASLEVDGFHALWRMDHHHAARLFDRAAEASALSAEYRSFWLAMRALALQEAAGLGDDSAAGSSVLALRAAATSGAMNTFFTRLRLAESRRNGEATSPENEDAAVLYVTWDRLISRLGAEGPAFERWAERLRAELGSGSHDEVARAAVRVGSDLLGLAADAPQAISGEHDAHWEYARPHRYIAFEVKLAPDAKRVISSDVDQAEGAVRALAEQSGADVRGFILTPWTDADDATLSRVDKVRFLAASAFLEYLDELLNAVREYRRGWAPESATRSARQDAVRLLLPNREALWDAHAATEGWVDRI